MYIKIKIAVVVGCELEIGRYPHRGMHTASVWESWLMDVLGLDWSRETLHLWTRTEGALRAHEAHTAMSSESTHHLTLPDTNQVLLRQVFIAA